MKCILTFLLLFLHLCAYNTWSQSGFNRFEYNTVRAALVRYDDIKDGTSSTLDQIQAAHYNYIICGNFDVYTFNPNDPNNTIFRDQMVNAFTQTAASGRNLRLIPQLPVASCWTAGWENLQQYYPDMEMNVTEGINRYGGRGKWGMPGLIEDPPGSLGGDKAFEDILNVIKEAHSLSGVNYPLEFIYLNGDEPYYYHFSLVGGLPHGAQPSDGNPVYYEYYEGEWSQLPDFSTLTPIKTGMIPNFNLSQSNSSDNFAFLYESLIRVPEDGIYTFYTGSDDGSKLYIDNNEVVNNDGIHSYQERSGSIYLTKGFHLIKATYFQRLGDRNFYVSYSGNSIPKQQIPSNVLGTLPNNVSYKYHEGQWDWLPDFSNITPLKTGKLNNFSLTERERDDNFAFEFRSFIRINIEGNYTFYLASDDGSKLYINYEEFIDNDGLHAFQEKSNSIHLEVGTYPIKVTYFERGGDQQLRVSYELPGTIAKQPIPMDILSATGHFALPQNRQFSRRERQYIENQVFNEQKSISSVTQELLVTYLYRKLKQVQQVCGNHVKVMLFSDWWDPQYYGPGYMGDRDGKLVSYLGEDKPIHYTPEIATLPGLSHNEKEIFKENVILIPWCYYTESPDGSDYEAEKTFSYFHNYNLNCIYAHTICNGQQQQGINYYNASKKFQDNLLGYFAVWWYGQWDPDGLESTNFTASLNANDIPENSFSNKQVKMNTTKSVLHMYPMLFE